MRYVIIGCGTVGTELARRWVTAGHEVLGTTTNVDRVPLLKEVCTEVAVLRGGDPEKVRDAVLGADAAVVAVSPPPDALADRRRRATAYREILVGTARAVAGARRRVVLLSSTLVYGDGGPGDGPVDEETLRTFDLEPAAQAHATAERVVMEVPSGTVLRLPLARTMPAEVCSADALAYRIDYRDAAAAAEFVVAADLTGLYNVVPDATVPPTYGSLLPDVAFRNEIKTPTRPISSAKLRAAGFAFAYS